MFGRRYGRHRAQRQSGGNFGLLLLAFQVMHVGLDNIPIVTLITLIINSAIFLNFPPDFVLPTKYACISFTNVWYRKEWQRLFTAPWYHGSDMHLYYNMSSLIWKGRKLEHIFGTVRFAVILLSFVIVSPLVQFSLSFAASEVLNDVSYLSECAVGFSGVLFALKVLMSFYDTSSNSYSQVIFLTVPTRIVFWFELILIQILVPNASFIGHLAGILTGLLFVKGPLREIDETIASIIESFWYGRPTRQYFNNSGTTGYSSRSYPGRDNGQNGNYRSEDWYTNGMSENDQMNWAMRDSMQQSSRQNTSTERQNSNTNRMYPDVSGYRYDHEPSAPPEEAVRSDGNFQNQNYPDIGFVRQQRLNRYS